MDMEVAPLASQTDDILMTKQTDLEAAFAAGWRTAARWADRDDLPADIGSPAYLADMHAALGPSVEPSGDDLDAARYRWLRDGNGYAPEEEMVRGGEDLDKLCDDGIAERTGEIT